MLRAMRAKGGRPVSDESQGESYIGYVMIKGGFPPRNGLCVISCLFVCFHAFLFYVIFVIHMFCLSIYFLCMICLCLNSSDLCVKRT